MSSLHANLATSFCSLLLCFQAFTQTNEQAQHRIEAFLKESFVTTIERIDSEAIESILKYNVYCIKRKTLNTYRNDRTHEDKFIVLDTGEEIIHFQHINNNTSLDYFLSLIREDFMLDPETAPVFEGVLDILYPVADWKIDKREYFFKDGSWYFLRDAYFRTKQGFKVTTDTEGKIVSICYKMKWDEPDRL
ncbi:hypothetical protein AB1A65_07415 [Muricauda sp. ANG21]|uniref:hypothetical protein n=1 Tax=Allomuricauda sp. ANG21 TaxID=3042468 RepID=UPI003452DBD9